MIEPDFDVVVIGGGIHGAGVAQAGAALGYRCLLLEKDDFAHGTSSRSSKLIHGGLRYLETAQIGLVRESLAEREVLLRVAPDLVHLVPFHVPIYASTRRRPWQVRIGLCAYALLGNLRRNARFVTVSRGAWGELDGLKTQDLQTVFRYWDAQTDDARLTRAVARSAMDLGARVALRSRFVSAARETDAYRVAYRTAEGDREVLCRAAVNAAGPWVNRVLDAVTPLPTKLGIDLVQGTHVLLKGALRRGVYYAEAPRDGRAVFIMPWGDRTLVGTTETPFGGEPDEVRPLDDEIDYLVETFRHYFPSRETEVAVSYAGLRVLPRGKGAAFHRRREMILSADDERAPRLVTLYGGKLTGYRSSALKVLRRLRRVLPAPRRAADTAALPLAAPPGERWP